MSFRSDKGADLDVMTVGGKKRGRREELDQFVSCLQGYRGTVVVVVVCFKFKKK